MDVKVKVEKMQKYVPHVRERRWFKNYKCLDLVCIHNQQDPALIVKEKVLRWIQKINVKNVKVKE